jgi:hypothetical protein
MKILKYLKQEFLSGIQNKKDFKIKLSYCFDSWSPLTPYDLLYLEFDITTLTLSR